VHGHELMEQLLGLPYGSSIAFDMGYTDYMLRKLLYEADYKFVCRLKANARFKYYQAAKVSVRILGPKSLHPQCE